MALNRAREALLFLAQSTPEMYQVAYEHQQSSVPSSSASAMEFMSGLGEKIKAALEQAKQHFPDEEQQAEEQEQQQEVEQDEAEFVVVEAEEQQGSPSNENNNPECISIERDKLEMLLQLAQSSVQAKEAHQAQELKLKKTTRLFTDGKWLQNHHDKNALLRIAERLRFEEQKAREGKYSPLFTPFFAAYYGIAAADEHPRPNWNASPRPANRRRSSSSVPVGAASVARSVEYNLHNNPPRYTPSNQPVPSIFVDNSAASSSASSPTFQFSQSQSQSQAVSASSSPLPSSSPAHFQQTIIRTQPNSATSSSSSSSANVAPLSDEELYKHLAAAGVQSSILDRLFAEEGGLSIPPSSVSSRPDSSVSSSLIPPPAPAARASVPDLSDLANVPIESLSQIPSFDPSASLSSFSNQQPFQQTVLWRPHYAQPPVSPSRATVQKHFDASAGISIPTSPPRRTRTMSPNPSSASAASAPSSQPMTAPAWRPPSATPSKSLRPSSASRSSARPHSAQASQHQQQSQAELERIRQLEAELRRKQAEKFIRRLESQEEKNRKPVPSRR